MGNCLPRLGGLILLLGSCLWGTAIPVQTNVEAVYAQDIPPETVTSKPLKVATQSLEPFVFLRRDQNSTPFGYSIDLWEHVAKRTQLDYEWVIFDNLEDMLTAVKTGEVDAAISGITITAEREKIMDFSYPYYETGFAILVSDNSQNLVEISLAYIISRDNLEAIVVLFGIALLSAHCIWFVERRHNPDMFRGEYILGIWDALWWSLVTATTVGYGDKSPKSSVGRLVAIAWMLGGLFIIAHFTSVFTNHHLQFSIDELRDLFGQKVATIKDSSSLDYLRHYPIKLVEFEHLDEAYQALHKGQVTAFVYDAPSLFYQAARDSNVQVVGHPFNTQDYGIALSHNSEYLEVIDHAILQLQEDGILNKLEQTWFPGSQLQNTP